jgi:hypothetical protein
MYDSIYDEAFGPSSPHRIARHHDDFSWEEPTWDDEVFALVSATITNPARAMALTSLLAVV